MDNVLIIIPTYNEAENIVRLIQHLQSLQPAFHVLVVDDGRDATGELVQAEVQQNPHVHLIKRSTKSGRGSAVIEGIRYGLQNGFTTQIEMDADFSHDPDQLSRLLAKAGEADVVIGSRYLPDSKIVGWSIYRIIFSHLANRFARTILGIPIIDYTNGYRLYNARAAAIIGSMTIVSKGYIVLSEIAYELYKTGCTFTEVPITFVYRERGASNFSLNEVKEAFWSVILIRRRYSARSSRTKA